MSFGEKKIVFIDDNFLIRQAVKSAIYSFVDENIQIYSSDNGIEGLGYIFAVKPDIIIVDSTLPKYSGLEVVEYIEKNQTLQANNSLIIVLNDSFKKRDLLPKNFIVVNKDIKDFIKNLASIIYSHLEDREGLVSDFKTAKQQFKGTKSVKALVLERIIEISNKKDTLHQKDYSSDFMMYIGYVRAFMYNIFSQFLFFFLSFFYREHNDASVAQKSKDMAVFRTRYYPAFFLTTFTIFFFISQLIILFVGGITIGSYKINSVFSQSLPSEAIVLNTNTSILFNYDSEVIEFRSEGVRLRALQKELSGSAEVDVLGASTSSGEVTPTDIPEPSPTPEPQTYFSKDNPFITLKQPVFYSEIESINMVGSTPAGTDIRFQLSPDGVRWFYYQEGSEWEETHQDYVSSNDIDTLNENLNKYQNLVIANTLHIKIFLHSNGEETPSLSTVSIVRAEELVTNTEDNLVIDEDIEVMPAGVEQEQIVNLSEVYVLNAAYANGNKIVQGRVDLPEGIIAGSGALTNINVNIYFGAKESLIGTTELVEIDKFGEKQYVFELIAPSTPGGFVSAELVFEGEISDLSKLVENSTFTVNESSDQADFSAGDGSCDYDNVTPGSQCTLRAAISEANGLGGSDNIDFNIPTTDPGYRDYDTPESSSSGDSLGGDDYWTIRPAALPVLSESTIIDGSTQMTNQGDFNTFGPEIEIKAQITPNAQNITINSLVINGQTIGEYAITSAVDISGFTLTSSYLGVDVKSLSDATSGTQGIRYAAGLSTNITIGNDTTDGNVISGFGGGIAWTCDGTGTQTLSIRGNRIGIGHTGNAIGNTAHGIALSGGCVVDIGGPDSVHRNYLGGNVRGISLDSSFVKEALITVRNNYFGTDLTGNSNRGNTSGIRMDSAGILFALPDNTIIVGGAPGEGNLFRFNASEGLRIEANKAFEASYNTFSDNGRGITVGSDTAPTYEQVRGEIYNNHIGSSTNDPYFGLNVGGNSFGIYNRSSSPSIKGNNVEGNTRNGILNIGTVNQSRTNYQAQYVSRPQIGGTAAFSGSLCNSIENNCIIGNIWSGISSFETVPTNEATLFTDNDFSTGNGSGNNRNIEQVWYGLFEIFSGTNRRTDLSGTVITFPVNTQVRTTDDPSTIVTSGTTTNLTCLNGAGVGCPAAGHTTGTVDNTQLAAPVGALLTNETTWYRIVEYVVDSSGNTINYDLFEFDSAHQSSSQFTYDGDSTNNVLSTGAGRALNGQNYTDRGEPWTDNPLAVRDIASNDFGRFQIMEVELVDANPVWDGSKWVITVDSTTDEDNVSTCGYDDGDGAYSGGGCGGPGGLPNGFTSLREAIIVSNNFTQSVTIEFDISTTDIGYRDYNDPDTPSSGDSIGGDDYWTIRPATDLPSMTGETDIDGSSQTTLIGNFNTSGPEIEIRPQTLKTQTGPQFVVGSDNSSINGVAVFGFGVTSNNTNVNVTSAAFTFSNSYLGLDAAGLGTVDAAVGWGYGMRLNSLSGNNLILNSKLSGLQDAVYLVACTPSSLLEIKGSTFGLNSSDLATSAKNARGINTNSGDNCHVVIGGDNLSDRNIISNSANQAVYHSFTDVSGEPNTIFEIYNNFFGTDPTGTVSIPNVDVDIRFQGDNYNGTSPQIIIGAQNKGNLFRFSPRAVWFNNPIRDAVVEYNTFGDHSQRSILVDAPNAGSHGQIIIRQNFIGQTSSDPYFGLSIGGNANRGIQMRDGNTDLIIENNEIHNCGTNGIEINSAGSHTIRGNRIEDCGIFGIYSTGLNLDVRTNTSTDLFSDPTIGGSSTLSGSKCGTTERNCINGNAVGGIYSMDTLPANESTLYADNDFTGGNGVGNNVNIEQSWYGLYEIFSTSRRTDLADGSFQMAVPSTMSLRDFNFAPVTLLSNLTLQCVADPAISTYCTGVDATAGVVNRTGYSSFWAPTGALLTNVTSWYRIAEYTIDGSGNKTDYSTSATPTGFESLHFAAKDFSFDGNGTTQTLTGDRGERWTDDAAASRDIATGDFSRFQIMEVEYVDANPIWNGSEWVITVDSTSDENNVSLSGFDDGGGAYSGGGTNGTDGLADGRTSLREAIIVANNHPGAERIVFNIPTSDVGWDTVNYPNAFMIQPSIALPAITSIITIDGASQTVFTGDTNVAITEDSTLTYSGQATTGPEIIIDATNTSGVINTTATELTVDSIGIYNQLFGGGLRPIAIGPSTTQLVVENCDLVGNNNGGFSFYSNINLIVSINNNVIRANSEADGTRDGIEGRVIGGTISNNQIVGNFAAGIGLYANPSAGTNTLTISNNLIKNNGLLSDEGKNGIIIAGNASREVIITSNTIIANQLDGITILAHSTDASRITISSNIIHSNGAEDIDISDLELQLVIPLTNNLGDGVTANDSGDTDTGGNDLQNFPVIETVDYLGAGQYRISGNLDENPTESPFEVEVCESDNNISGHGGCIDSLGFTTASSPWDIIVTITGDNGTQNRVFSALATNANGSTSEFSENFIASISNPDYSIIEYPVPLTYPMGGITIDDLTPLLDWNPSQVDGELNPEVDHYDVYLNGQLIGTVAGNVTQFQITSPIALGQHTWEVVAVRTGNVETGRSSQETFTITPPNYDFSGIYPVGVSIDNFSPLFTWGELDGADEYDFYLNGELVEQGLISPEYQWPLDDPLPEGEYEWFVVAIRIEPDGSRTEIGRTDVLSFEIEIIVTTTPTVTPTPRDISSGDDDEIPNQPTINRIIQFVPFIATGAIGVALSVSLGVPGAILQIIGFLIGLPPRKKKYWGVVFDIENYVPIPFAVIRLINNLGKQVEQTTSNVEGKYSLNTVESGSYTLQVGAAGYSQVMNTIEIFKDNDIVEDIELSREGQNNFLNKFIYHNRKRLFDYSRYFIFILMIFGFLYTVYALTISPILINMIFLFGYFVVIVMHISNYIRKKAILRTVDKKSGIGVSQTSVRIYQQGKQVDLGVTDRNGNLRIGSRDGEYEVLALANGYAKYSRESKIDYLGKDLEIKLSQVEGSKFQLKS